MKSKLTLALVTTWIMALLIAVPAFSATFSLTKIGSLDLAGKKYSEWWYTGLNPTFYGTSASGDTITVSVKAKDYQDTADNDGNWAVNVPMTAGDYDVSITNGTETYIFKLHLGQDFPGSSSTAQTTSSTTSATVPDTGINQTTAILFGTGVSLLAMYFYFFESNKKRTVFEKRIVSE